MRLDPDGDGSIAVTQVLRGRLHRRTRQDMGCPSHGLHRLRDRPSDTRGDITIDLGVAPWNQGNGWAADPLPSYSGEFNGNGHTVAGLTGERRVGRLRGAVRDRRGRRRGAQPEPDRRQRDGQMPFRRGAGRRQLWDACSACSPQVRSAATETYRRPGGTEHSNDLAS